MPTELNNQRVTNVILSGKLDTLQKNLDVFKTEMKEDFSEAITAARLDHDLLLLHTGQIAANAIATARNERQIEKVDSARKLETRIEVIATAILAFFGLSWPRG